LWLKNNMRKVLNFISFASLFSAIFLILVYIYWTWIPKTPLVFNSDVKVLTPKVRSGEYISYSLDYCKNVSLPATLTKEFIDGVIFATPPIVVNNPKGCNKTVGQTLVPNLPSGIYELRFSYIYKLNPIKEVTVVTTSTKFEIMEAR